MSDKIDLLYDLIKSDKEESQEFRKEAREQHAQTNERLILIETGLAEHMRRTDLLEELHKDNAKRIVALETPGKIFIVLIKWITGIGAVATAIAALITLFK